MNKKIITTGSLFFIFQMQIMNCSYFTQLFAFGKISSDTTQEIKKESSSKNCRNSWVDLTFDESGNVLDKTEKRFVDFCTTPEITEIETPENGHQRSTREHIQKCNKKRAASLANRTVLDQENPQRKTRSDSYKIDQQTQTHPTTSQTSRPQILHLVLKCSAPK